MPDLIAQRVREVGGTNVSGWLTKAARNQLLAEEADAIAAWEREHRDPRDEADDEAAREHARAIEGA